MSDSIHYKGLTLKALNLYCKSQDGTQVFRAYERPSKYGKGHPFGCGTICEVSGNNCLGTLGDLVRPICTNEQILWRKLI
jgi:hypothetical protein